MSSEGRPPAAPATEMLSANNASRRGGRHGKRAAGAGDLTTALDGPTALPLDELTEDLWRVTGTLLLAAHDRQEREDPDERREAEQTLRHARPEVERARAALADRLDNPEPQNDDDLDDELRSEARERLAHADHALAGLDAADYRAHWERHEVAYGRRVAAELRAADPRNGAVPELLSDPRRVHALAQLKDAEETAYDELRDDLVIRGLPTAKVDEIGQAVRSKVDQLAAARREREQRNAAWEREFALANPEHVRSPTAVAARHAREMRGREPAAIHLGEDVEPLVVAQAAFEALVADNDPPAIFVRGGKLTRVLHDEHGRARRAAVPRRDRHRRHARRHVHQAARKDPAGAGRGPALRRADDRHAAGVARPAGAGRDRRGARAAGRRQRPAGARL